MKNVNEITNDFGNLVFNISDEAISYAVNEFGWKQEDIIESKESLEIEVNSIIQKTSLYAIYVDSGSDDYIYFIGHNS